MYVMDQRIVDSILQVIPKVL